MACNDLELPFVSLLLMDCGDQGSSSALPSPLLNNKSPAIINIKAHMMSKIGVQGIKLEEAQRAHARLMQRRVSTSEAVVGSSRKRAHHHRSNSTGSISMAEPTQVPVAHLVAHHRKQHHHRHNHDHHSVAITPRSASRRSTTSSKAAKSHKLLRYDMNDDEQPPNIMEHLISNTLPPEVAAPAAPPIIFTKRTPVPSNFAESHGHAFPPQANMDDAGLDQSTFGTSQEVVEGEDDIHNDNDESEDQAANEVSFETDASERTEDFLSQPDVIGGASTPQHEAMEGEECEYLNPGSTPDDRSVRSQKAKQHKEVDICFFEDKSKPIELPPPKPAWKATMDPHTGRTYYYHRKTGKTTWRPPTEAFIPLVPPMENEDIMVDLLQEERKLLGAKAAMAVEISWESDGDGGC